MKKSYLLVFAFVSFQHFGQNFPDLNASTGNENEFPVDQNSHLYMFQGNRLSKTDQNFNVLWAKTYTGITYKNLLLSKTGSIYFLGASGLSGKNVIGKLTADGDIAWIRNTTGITSSSGSHSLFCERLLLDRNDNLVVSGDGFLLKTDTNGKDIRLWLFSGKDTYIEQLSIIADSSGHYKLFGSGGSFEKMMWGLYTFSDNSGTFTDTKGYGIGNDLYNENWKLIQSKISDHFYVRASADIKFSTNTYFVSRFSTSGIYQWLAKANYPGAYWQTDHLEEDNNGNLLVSVSNWMASQQHTSFILQMDPAGNIAPHLAHMLSGYPAYDYNTSSYVIPLHAARVMANNDYYFDVSGGMFPSNPLTVQRFDSTLSFTCASAYTVAGGPTNMSTVPVEDASTPTIVTIASFTLPTLSTTVTPITFSVNPNFCIVNDIANDSGIIQTTIFPNPASDRISVRSQTFPLSMEIFDLAGKTIQKYSGTNTADISGLSSGVYILKIEHENGHVNRKLIVDRQ